MTKKPLIALLLLLSVGFVAGMVVTGRLDQASFSFATPQTPATTARPAAAAAAGAALPDLSSIAEQAVKASANISSTQVMRQRNDDFMQFFFGGGRQYSDREAQSLGSGVVVTPDGYLLTNAHVLLGNGGQIREVKATVAGHEEMPAKIIGIDTLTDLAVLKIDATNLPTLPWGDSGKVRIAEWVLAIGNPFEFNQTVTLGIVSATGRIGTQMGAYGQLIQTDAAINPGNSGGALINSRGELIGINSMIYTRSGGSEGLGFAIPANLAQRIMKELIANGAVNWGTILDVDFTDVRVNAQVAPRYGINQPSVVIVYDIDRASGAARAGLRQNDVLLSLEGKPVPDTSELGRMLADMTIGGTANVEVLHADGSREKLKLPIGSTQQQRRR
jgi:S1-C subfamily serine protease